jgi:CBS domain-containing protein
MKTVVKDVMTSRVIGVVSEADMLAKEVLNADPTGTITAMLHRREQDKADGLTARDLMTHPAVTVTPDDTVEQAARLMVTNARIKPEHTASRATPSCRSCADAPG